jgi:1-acyl-sn-glycerol-3-phosphate acyltransferase
MSAPAGSKSQLPQRREDLRPHLPGLEPDRQITDWGRSERIESLVDRTLYEFLYHYWFRVEVQGIENVPEEGGVVLVANRSGALPSDAAMIAKALREERPRAAGLHVASEHRLASVPLLGMMARKLGAVSAHPANLHRLLFDEGQLVLVFPEGAPSRRKPLKERYRLIEFHDSAFVTSALRAEVPIVPVAVLGAEEALPVLAATPMLRRIPYLPLTSPIPLPAKFKVRFLEPIWPRNLDGHRAPDALAQDIRALIAENLLELVAMRRSVWSG